jgi:hypothetical protein
MGRRQREPRVRDYGPEGRDPAAVCGGSTPLRSVVCCVTEPKPDPGASRGHAQNQSFDLFVRFVRMTHPHTHYPEGE